MSGIIGPRARRDHELLPRDPRRAVDQDGVVRLECGRAPVDVDPLGAQEPPEPLPANSDDHRADPGHHGGEIDVDVAHPDAQRVRRPDPVGEAGGLDQRLARHAGGVRTLAPQAILLDQRDLGPHPRGRRCHAQAPGPSAQHHKVVHRLLSRMSGPWFSDRAVGDRRSVCEWTVASRKEALYTLSGALTTDHRHRLSARRPAIDRDRGRPTAPDWPIADRFPGCLMSKKVAVFWPGDYRAKPNEWALPQSRETTRQLVAALTKLGRSPYVVEGFLTRPDEAIAKLGPIDDPMVGVFVHWVYGPHTVDGVVGKDNPLLLASQLLGDLARPGRPAQHRRLARERRPGRLARLDRRRRLDGRRRVHGAARRVVLDRPDRLRHGRARTTPRAVSAEAPAVAERGARRDPPQARPGPDARRHVDGDDQRLLRPAAARPDRLQPSTRSTRPGSSSASRSVDRRAGRRRLPVRPGQGA